MPSTNTLQRSVNVAQQFVRGAPLTGVLGVTNEPALTIGDNVRQTILGPPFSWRWNRNTYTFSAIPGTQDYSTTITNMGWVEKANALAGSTQYELEILLNASQESIQNQLTWISPRLDNDAGTITFRLLPVPEQDYTITVDYQASAPSFASLADPWAPIPDYMYFLYQMGFNAEAMMYWGDERGPYMVQTFLRTLLAASSGLSESQKNIFLATRLNSERMEQAEIGNSAAGRAGRGQWQQG